MPGGYSSHTSKKVGEGLSFGEVLKAQSRDLAKLAPKIGHVPVTATGVDEMLAWLHPPTEKIIMPGQSEIVASPLGHLAIEMPEAQHLPLERVAEMLDQAAVFVEDDPAMNVAA